MALPLLIAAAAFGSPPPAHVAWTRAALDRVPVAKTDRTPERAELHAQNLDVFAVEIARVSANAPLPARQWAALLGAIGSNESNFDTEIVAGRCAKWACDHGRAKGAFQNHKLSFTADLWPVADGNITAQVDMADRTLRRTWGTCTRLGVPFPASAFRGYAGVSCSWPMRGEQQRVNAYLRLMATKTGATAK